MALKETIRMYVGLPGILAKARDTFNFTHAYPDGTSKTFTFPKGTLKYILSIVFIYNANIMIAFLSNEQQKKLNYVICSGRIDSVFLCWHVNVLKSL